VRHYLTNKLGMAVRSLNPRYSGVRNGRTKARSRPRQKYETLSKKKLKHKGLGSGSSGRALVFA
jgi:hypothetical protein